MQLTGHWPARSISPGGENALNQKRTLSEVEGRFVRLDESSDRQRFVGSQV